MPFDAAAGGRSTPRSAACLAETRIITPDEVRGAHATLEEAVRHGGWPTFAASRGRVLFFMEGAGVDAYLADAPGLEARLVFAGAEPGDPHAAVVFANDALGDGATISERWARLHRPHDGRRQHHRGPQRRRARRLMRAAFAGGAQIVTTDYYRPDPRGNTPGSGWTNYQGEACPAAARRAATRSTAAQAPSSGICDLACAPDLQPPPAPGRGRPPPFPPRPEYPARPAR